MILSPDIRAGLSSIAQSAEILGSRNFDQIYRDNTPRRSGIYPRAAGGIIVNHLSGWDSSVRIATLVVDPKGVEMDRDKPKFRLLISEENERRSQDLTSLVFDSTAETVEPEFGAIEIVTAADIADLARVIDSAL